MGEGGGEVGDDNDDNGGHLVREEEAPLDVRC